jgi:hypothetical protein
MKHWIVASVGTLCLLLAGAALATYHTWRVEQIYSNADGTVQFIVLYESEGNDGENLLKGRALRVTQGGVTKSFVFPTNLPGGSCGYYGCESSPTAYKKLLIATPGFAALGIVSPDYTLPSSFLPVDGVITYADTSLVYSYTSLPTDGTHALGRNGAPIQNVATNFSGNFGSVVAAAPAANYTAVWWASPPGSEAGWGINFAHQGDIIFATWFTYDANGKPWWLIAEAHKTAPGVYSGDVSTVIGPAFNRVPFPPGGSPGGATETIVGTATLTFAGDGSATFRYTVNGITQTKTIVRQEFGTLPTCIWGAQPNLALATNYQDLWWNSSESGWGINFAHQGDIIFATWFTYDASGTPWWLIAEAHKTAPGVYSGGAATVTGPAFNAVPFPPAGSPGGATETTVGTATLTFADGNNATFAYSVNGVSQTKQITRQVFAEPGTVCQ